MSHPKRDEEEWLSFCRRIETYAREDRPIAYLDESGFVVDALREYGYAEQGKRCEDTHDWHKKGRVNALGALIGTVLLTVCLITGSVNADVFYAWVKQDLLPKLPEHSVVVMDNVSFHKRQDIQKAITSAGHTLEYMLVYSPDLNPIEKKWAQAKPIRREKMCDPETLFREYVS